MADKVFKTHDELIDLLVSRGVDISTGEAKRFAKTRLQHEGYYNLINGYKKLFLKEPKADEYKEGTTVNEMYALFVFDQRLREIFLRYILEVERNIKCLIAYEFPQKYGHDNYLLYKNFDLCKRDSHKNIISMLSDIQHQIASRGSDPSIRHYLDTYGYIPLWVLNNILSFGQISKFYFNMKQTDRQNISRTFKIMDSELETLLKYLTAIRNCCAHNNRLYCFRSHDVMIDTKYHTNLQIPNTGEYIYGKRDLFAAVTALKLLLPSREFKQMITEIDNAIIEIKPALKVLKIEEILSEMGFPSNWKKIKSMQK
ncbi:MAG: Abi family protein [Lachnospiraceae bacterium]|nr:Abi family protein [Lachnospiraceae bacterium]